MSLREYRRKRDFRKTSEPSGEAPASTVTSLFVVQKHAATRLHYDFRLELDGVLKSWAVPKGPSLDPAVKSLAIEVEDHPVAYAAFEGIIPQGEYGGGTVLVWDHGAWEPEGDPHKSLKKGRLKFQLHGEKLNGGWSLIRIRGDGDRHNWLLIKQSDETAVPDDEHGVTDRETRSVITNRELAEVAADADRVWTKHGERKGTKAAQPHKAKPKSSLPSKTIKTKQPAAAGNGKSTQGKKSSRPEPLIDPAAASGAKRRALPRDLAPQLATAAAVVPEGEQWLHELKFDGYRILCEIENGAVRMLTRKGNDWTGKFTVVAAEMEKLPISSAVIDGELVAVDDRGVSDFQKLQNSLRNHRPEEMLYYAFDLLYADGYDLRQAPLTERKELLARVLLAHSPGNDGTVRYSDHIRGRGREVLQQSCQSALEGIISKRGDSTYESRRSRAWLKNKCQGRQEFVIGGFTKPGGSRTGFGALLLGYYETGRLIYCGRVGTGFTEDSLRELTSKLKTLVTSKMPFDDPPTGSQRRGVTWVEPKLVGEVEFTEWTNGGNLRHPSFQGLRLDKSAKEVVRERPQPLSAGEAEGRGESLLRSNGRGASHAAAERHGKARHRSSGEKPRRSPMKENAVNPQVAGVSLSNADRILYPEPGLTKRQIAEYYEQAADWVLPHVADRPLTLVRCPQGCGKACFYQKHWTETLPEAVKHVPIREKETVEEYVVIHDVAGLVSLVQISVLELHPWPSRIDHIEKPDRLVFDLDPGPGVTWKRVIQAATDVRDVLSELGPASFVRTSGGKGLHVVVPLTRRNSWDELRAFSQHVAAGLAKHVPDRYVANMRKNLRQGKVFIDYLRNQRGATAIASYSTRARAGAAVATPIEWDELQDIKGADVFTVTNLPARLQTLRQDPWREFDEVRQSLTKAALEGAENFANEK